MSSYVMAGSYNTSINCSSYYKPYENLKAGQSSLRQTMKFNRNN